MSFRGMPFTDGDAMPPCNGAPMRYLISFMPVESSGNPPTLFVLELDLIVY
jgi:hypothetical protein